MDRDKCHIGETGKTVTTRMYEHKVSTRHDPLSFIFFHEDQEAHKFNLDNVEIVDLATNKHAKDFLESWYSSNNSITRHIGLGSRVMPAPQRVH